MSVDETTPNRRRRLGAVALAIGIVAVVVATIALRRHAAHEAATPRASQDRGAPRPPSHGSFPEAVVAARNVPPAGTCPAELAGRVHDAGGGAVAGASITVLYDIKADGSAANESGASARSDETGGYTLCALASPLSLVRVSADGYGTVFVRLALLDRLRRDFRLVPEATLHGRVVDEHGAAVSGATIDALPAAAGLFEAAARRATSDRAGEFVLDGLTPGAYDLVARTKDSESDLAANVAATVTTSPPVRLVVRQRARLSGRVLDETGAAVVGAVVAARSLQFGSRRSTSATTDAQGAFVLERCSEGLNIFDVDDHAVVQPSSILIGKTPLHDVTVRVTRLPSVTGLVVRDSLPIVGAVVSLRDKTQRSDAEGRFAFTGVRPGPYQMTARDPATGAAGERRVVIPTSDAIVVMLTDTGSLQGTVRDPRGAPVVGAWVSAFCNDLGFEATATTDAAGHFLVRGLVECQYAFSVRRSARATPMRPHVPHPLAKPSANQPVELVVKIEEGVIAGTVVDDKQQPVSDVRVVALRGAKRPTNVGHMTELPSSVTGPDGAFVIEQLEATPSYGLQARDANGNEAFASGIAPGTRDVVVTLQRAGVIEGRLVGFAATPDVQALRIEPGQFFPPLRATIDGDRYRIDGVPPTSWEVRTASAGESASAVVTVAPGQTVKADLQSRGSATIRGRVIDWASGAALAGIRCVVGHSDGTHRATRFLPGEAWTDATGAFEIDPAPASPCTVTCWGPSDVSDGIAAFDLARGAAGNATIPIVTSPRQPYLPLGLYADPMLIRYRVMSVDPQSTAETAGLRPGDLVVTIDGRDARALSHSGVFAAIHYRPTGSTAKLVVERDGTPVPITLPIVETAAPSATH